ncbi:MAG TPA: nucleotidyltransferase family protein [Acidobacteriaceae bacterium]
MNDRLPSVALLAGGLSTRLRPITANIPKSLVPVAGEPFIAHQLRLLVNQGIREVVICCGFLGEQIEEYVRDGAVFGCSVSYSYDGTPLKGTGGAIKKALPKLGEHFFVMYGDSYLPIALCPVYERFLQMGKDGLMTVFRNENQWDTSNVEFQDLTILRYDKVKITPQMQHIDYGLGILRSAAFEPWTQKDIFDLSMVYGHLVNTGQLSGYEVTQRFYEIGTPRGLNETCVMLLRLKHSG